MNHILAVLMLAATCMLGRTSDSDSAPDIVIENIALTAAAAAKTPLEASLLLDAVDNAAAAGTLPDISSYKEQVLRRVAANDGLTDASGGRVGDDGSLANSPAATTAEFFLDDESVPVETEAEAEVDPSSQHRTNFASNAAGAVIMAANPEMTGVASLLGDDADSYALSRCDVKKFVIIGLSEDVLVDALIVSNEEKYASTVRHIRVLGAQKYPAAEWIVLGNFTAGDALGEQSFPVTVRSWVRYIKLSWLSHYGKEFYCTWTRVKVHGSTMLEDLQQQVFSSEAEVHAARQQMHLEAAMRAAATPSQVLPVAVNAISPAVSATATATTLQQPSASAAPSFNEHGVTADRVPAAASLGVSGNVEFAVTIAVDDNATESRKISLSEMPDDATTAKKSIVALVETVGPSPASLVGAFEVIDAATVGNLGTSTVSAIDGSAGMVEVEAAATKITLEALSAASAMPVLEQDFASTRSAVVSPVGQQAPDAGAVVPSPNPMPTPAIIMAEPSLSVAIPEHSTPSTMGHLALAVHESSEQPSPVPEIPLAPGKDLGIQELQALATGLEAHALQLEIVGGIACSGSTCGSTGLPVDTVVESASVQAGDALGNASCLSEVCAVEAGNALENKTGDVPFIVGVAAVGIDQNGGIIPPPSMPTGETADVRLMTAGALSPSTAPELEVSRLSPSNAVSSESAPIVPVSLPVTATTAAVGDVVSAFPGAERDSAMVYTEGVVGLEDEPDTTAGEDILFQGLAIPVPTGSPVSGSLPLPDTSHPMLLEPLGLSLGMGMDDHAEDAEALEAQAVAALSAVAVPKLSGEFEKPGHGRGVGGAPVTANVFKTLTRKLKDLEIDNALIHGYLADMHGRYTAAVGALSRSTGSVRLGLAGLRGDVQAISVGAVSGGGPNIGSGSGTGGVLLHDLNRTVHVLEASLVRVERALASVTRALIRHMRDGGVDVSVGAGGEVNRWHGRWYGCEYRYGRMEGDEDGGGLALVHAGRLPAGAGVGRNNKPALPAPETPVARPTCGVDGVRIDEGDGREPIPTSLDGEDLERLSQPLSAGEPIQTGAGGDAWAAVWHRFMAGLWALLSYLVYSCTTAYEALPQLSQLWYWPTLTIHRADGGCGPLSPTLSTLDATAMEELRAEVRQANGQAQLALSMASGALACAAVVLVAAACAVAWAASARCNGSVEVLLPTEGARGCIQQADPSTLSNTIQKDESSARVDSGPDLDFDTKLTQEHEVQAFHTQSGSPPSPHARRVVMGMTLAKLPAASGPRDALSKRTSTATDSPAEAHSPSSVSTDRD